MNVLFHLCLVGCATHTESVPKPILDGEAPAPRPETLVLAADQREPWELKLVGDYLYFTEGRAPRGHLRRVAKRGGPVSDLAEIESPEQASISVAAEEAYFFSTAHVLSKVSIRGGPPSAIADLADLSVSGTALLNERVHWVELSKDPPGAVLGSVSKDGGPATRTEFPDAKGTGGGAPVIVASDLQNVYASAATGTGFFRFPRGSGPASVVSVGRPIIAFALDETAIFFTSTDGVFAVHRDGGPVRSVAESRDTAGVAVDASHVYFVVKTATNGRVLKVPKSGGETTVVADGERSPRAIAVDETSVYFTCLDDGTIKKVAKAWRQD